MIDGPSAQVLAYIVLVPVTVGVVAAVAWISAAAVSATFNPVFMNALPYITGATAVSYVFFELRVSIEASHRYTTILNRKPNLDLCDWRSGIVITPGGSRRPANVASFRRLVLEKRRELREHP